MALTDRLRDAAWPDTEHWRDIRTEAADMLDAIDRKHHQIWYASVLGEYRSCAECAPTNWPCQTHRILHPEDGE